MSASISHPSPSSPAADTHSAASLHATIAAPHRPATLSHHSTVSAIPAHPRALHLMLCYYLLFLSICLLFVLFALTSRLATPPLQHAASYHHPAPPSNLGSTYYAPDLGASYYAPAAQPPANLAQSYHAPAPQTLAAPPANLGHSYHAPSPQAVQPPPANFAVSYHAPAQPVRTLFSTVWLTIPGC